MKENNHQIYIIFVEDSVYIGRSKRLIERISEHGMLWCQWGVLESCSGEIVREKEAFWVKYFLDQGCDVLNIEKDCSRPGCLGHSPQVRLLLSEKLRGRKFSEETRIKLSLALKGNENSLGRKQSDETKIKCRDAHLGKAKSLEHVQKLKGHSVSEETRKKIGDSKRGNSYRLGDPRNERGMWLKR